MYWLYIIIYKCNKIKENKGYLIKILIITLIIILKLILQNHKNKLKNKLLMNIKI